MQAHLGLFTDPWGTDGNGTHGSRSPSGDNPGSSLSLRFALRVARRRWRLCLAVAVAGALMGVGVHFAVPHAYSSSSDLYLTEPAASTPADAMANDVGLLQTRAVAARALAALHLRIPASTFLSSYKGVAQTNSILTVTIGAPTRADALARNRALDAAFLELRARQFRLQTNAVVSVLRSQISTTEGHLQTLNRAITQASGRADTKSATLLTNLINQRSNDQTQVVQLQGTIQQDLVALASVTQGSRVLDPPALLKQSAHKALAEDGLAGLVGGFAVAFALIASATLISDRPRHREDVATLLGAPIELSLQSTTRLPGGPVRRLGHFLRHTSPSLKTLERHLRAHVEATPCKALAIVTIGAPTVAARAVLQVATSLASEGKAVLVADVVDERPLAHLVGASKTRGLRTVSVAGHPVQIFVGTGDPADMVQTPIPASTDVVLVLTDTDPSFGAHHLAAWVSEAVVLVAREKTTSTRIAMGAELLRHEGISIRAGFLFGAFPEDDTLGVMRRSYAPLAPHHFDAEVAPS